MNVTTAVTNNTISNLATSSHIAVPVPVLFYCFQAYGRRAYSSSSTPISEKAKENGSVLRYNGQRGECCRSQAGGAKASTASYEDRSLIRMSCWPIRRCSTMMLSSWHLVHHSKGPVHRFCFVPNFQISNFLFSKFIFTIDGRLKTKHQ